MTIEKSRAMLTGRIWQAIAQSGVDVSTLSEEQQTRLVDKIAEQMLIALDAILDDVEKPAPAPKEEPPAQAAQTATDTELVLWEGRPFLSLVESYVITSERLKVIKGFVSRDFENFELIRVQDIDYNQGVSERMLGIGDIIIRGADPSHDKIELRNVRKPEEVYEILRKAWLEARKRHGLQFREFM